MRLRLPDGSEYEVAINRENPLEGDVPDDQDIIHLLSLLRYIDSLPEGERVSVQDVAVAIGSDVTAAFNFLGAVATFELVTFSRGAARVSAAEAEAHFTELSMAHRDRV